MGHLKTLTDHALDPSAPESNEPMINPLFIVIIEAHEVG